MKTFITAVLCFSLAVLTARAGSTNSVAVAQAAAKPASTNTVPTPPAQNAALLEVMLGLVVIVIGATVYIKVKSTVPDQNAVVSLVLEKSYDHGNWTPVYTNANVTLNGTNMIDFFSEQMTDSAAFYRAKKLR